MLLRDDSGVHTDSVWPNAYRDGHVPVRLLNPLKGISDWKIGQTRMILTTASSAQAEATVHKGMRLILFGMSQGRHSHIELDLSPRDCALVPLNETNLAIVQRGIAQDYSAGN